MEDQKALVVIKNEVPITTSLKIAETFGKLHKHILRDIEKLECPDEFSQTNFGPSVYIKRGKEYGCYNITRDGFTLLVMGFTGKRAMQFKLKYIDAFNLMEQKLKQQQTAPKQKSLSELQMIAKIALDMDKQNKQLEQQQNQIKYQEEKQTTLEKRIDHIENNSNQNSEFYTILAYARLNGIKIPKKKTNLLGRYAAKTSRECEYEIGKVSDERYGEVNAYHVEILEYVFEEKGLI